MKSLKTENVKSFYERKLLFEFLFVGNSIHIDTVQSLCLQSNQKLLSKCVYVQFSLMLMCTGKQIIINIPFKN